MNDPGQGAQANSTSLTIPDEVKQNFPELINLIVSSESMNNEERQYWINILPIMTPDQVQNLRGILVNEKRQLAAIDKKYEKEIEQIGQTQLLKKMEEERRKRRSQRENAEQKAFQEEEGHAEDILSKINEIE